MSILDMPRNEPGALPARSDLVALASLLTLWVVMSGLVNPIGDFPIYDDWRYALSVKSVLDSSRFELPFPVAPNIFIQAYWGALFCLPFGFSFTALRFSTLTLGAIGISACYLLLREIGGSRFTALLGGIALAANPLYFWLAHTFMTDVPFTAAVTAALWLFVRGLRREEEAFLWAGILIALLAILIRQFALLFLLAFGVAYVVRRGGTLKALVVATVSLVLGTGLHVSYQRWMIETGRTPFFELASVSNFVPTPVGPFVISSLRTIAYALPYLGLFTAPFLASVALSGSDVTGRHRRSLICFVVVALALLGVLYHANKPMPALGDILTPSGLGLLFLRDTGLLGLHLPAIPAYISIFWIVPNIIGALCGAGILLYFAQTAAQVIKEVRQPEWRTTAWLQVLTLILVAGYGALLLLIGFKSQLFDRYLLLSVPAILVLVLIKELPSASLPLRRCRTLLSLSLAVVYMAFSVAATHDFLAWNRTRWMATGTLMDAGIPPHKIDGGLEFNGWYSDHKNYYRIPRKDWWWVGVDDDEYVIASGPLDGYRELQRFSFRRWLLSSDSNVVVLRRLDVGGDERTP